MIDKAQIRVGQFIRTARENLGLTQAQVSERTARGTWHLSRAAVSAIERGQNFPGLEAILAISEVLEIDPREIIDRARAIAVEAFDLDEKTEEALERLSSRLFWSGDNRNAVEIYQKLLERLSGNGETDAAERLAGLELRRAATLRRAGALLSAAASAERVLLLVGETSMLQIEAYLLLGTIHCQRGHLPLASDSVRRAAELASTEDSQYRTRTKMLEASIAYAGKRFSEARELYEKARQYANENERQHLTNIEGKIGMCCWGEGERERARKWLERAVSRATEMRQSVLAANWGVELGRLAFELGETEESKRQAQDALSFARPRQHDLTIFRAEWLLHRIARRDSPGETDERRLKRLKELYQELQDRDSIDEVREFRRELI